MKCQRCGGEMISEVFYSDDGHFEGLRCIQCGEVIDNEILKNREWSANGGRRSRAEVRNVARARVSVAWRNIIQRGVFKYEPFL